MKKLIYLLTLALLLIACNENLIFPDTEQATDPNVLPDISLNESVKLLTPPKRIGFDEFPRAIPLAYHSPERDSLFNYDVIGDFIVGYTQEDMSDTLNGYKTDNQSFLDQVLEPAITPYLDSLSDLQKYQAINALILFIYESYIDYYGNSFYRWGGDITDRDQPQTATSHRTSMKRYGMDCSGFGASAYEAAVQLGLLDSTDMESAFSWMGFKYICDRDPEIEDGGGRSGTTNNFRLEVSDFSKVGQLITTIDAGSTPTDDQIDLMQAGDAVIKSGHMGILVEINETLYFLESGGSTVNEEGLYTPYLAKDALADFASYRTTTILRCLPDKETSTGIVHY